MRHELVVPDLGLGERPVALSLWLVELDEAVTARDRIVELLSDGVTIDLPAPASGVLIETIAAEDDVLCTGQVLGVIESGVND